MKSIIIKILETEIKNEILKEFYPAIPKTLEEIEAEVKSYTEFASWNVKGEMLKDAIAFIKNSGIPKVPVDLYDIASGRGNDLNRWISLGLKFVVGLEYNSSQMAEAIVRYKKKSKQIRVQYIQGSAINFNNVRSAIMFKKVNLISNNFAMNYFFGSEKDANTFLKGVSESLNTGGLFIGTATDGDFIREIFEMSDNPDFIKTDLYYIKKKSDLSNDFGSIYEFKLNTPYFENGSFDEYIISKNTLVTLAEKYKLIPVSITENLCPIYNLSIRPLIVNKLTSEMYSRPYDIASLYFGFSFIKVE